MEPGLRQPANYVNGNSFAHQTSNEIDAAARDIVLREQVIFYIYIYFFLLYFCSSFDFFACSSFQLIWLLVLDILPS